MTRTELLEMIANGASSGVELKSDDVLRDYGYVDARGMGVRTKIVPLLVEHNGIEPEFEATDDFLAVRMFRGTEQS